MLIIVWFFDDLRGWAMMVAIITEKKLHNQHKQVMVFFFAIHFLQESILLFIIKSCG